MPFLPTLQGTAAVRAPAEDFFPAFVRRVEKGLFPGAPGWRSRYAVVEQERDRVRFHATDWMTAISVGLNDVRLDMPSSGAVRYRVRYLRWAAYALLLSAGIGLLLIAGLTAFDLPGYIAKNSASRITGLSVEQNVKLAWGFALFWGFLWPWILIALHKLTLRRLVTRLIQETDTAAFAWRAQHASRVAR